MSPGELRSRLQGVVGFPITPFKADLSLDLEGLRRNRPQTDLWLVTDAVRAIHADAGSRLLRDWAQRGVKMVTTADVLRGVA